MKNDYVMLSQASIKVNFMSEKSSDAARILSQLGSAKGGKARAESLSSDKRKEIAKKAADARWGKQAKHEANSSLEVNLLEATHQGELKIGDIALKCFVLEDERRVISGRTMTSAIGMKGRGQGTSRIVDHKTLNPFISKDLALAIENPIFFVGAGSIRTNPSTGFEATVLVEICEAILKARDANALKTEQEIRYAQHCEILMRGFAYVGVISLVDEATGYQRDRASDALSVILEAFIAKELQPWVHTFKDDYYEELFRLRGLLFPRDTVKRPQYFGHLTNDIVYKRLAPGVLEELKNNIPKCPSGRQRYQLHRGLTPDLGHPKLKEYLASVTTIMKLSDNYKDFESKLDRIHPKYNETLPLDLSFDFDDSGEGL